MNVIAETIEVDADTFGVVGVVRSVDHVRRRGAEGAVQSELLSTYTLIESGRQEEVTELSFGLVDGVGAVPWLLRGLLRWNVVRSSKVQFGGIIPASTDQAGAGGPGILPGGAADECELDTLPRRPGASS